ncbi:MULTISPECIES: phytanoyl-CoA dioxygenase family protein [Moorena]|uniref:Phytanoyl-CoA dioxygenase n=1 Tax=Moorena producens 3L TaxID=489825 RepID=F4XY73_9CYAN|nr:MULTISPECIES: phytanoyl-CoA dioxygenase family protein [Moorena]NEQ12869.1 phytanoyl-CoA dioxygenase [Moorena sp. SIO3E2]EGJ30470.1 hypothetical protein LYNGBM3L_50280 [Moorena producens 3L]NEP31287.1 phytanoyl-CoA dioxygenase [Moorena sp. SIO3B2]NEP67004.1 phytanoyl-CoA dioxygenase [Moorena sp. SIO3A5]NER88573.1 phytanoyl-CoA dioxygenase [Moorena sp. SIO3A2]
MSWNTLNITSTAEIVSSIREKGYYFAESALDKIEADRLLEEIDFDEILINKNDLGVVCSGNQKFLSHCLAKSKRAYDLITSQQVLDVCNAYLKVGYQLINHRFCQTRRGFHMPWHTDNNLLYGSQFLGKHQMQGLVFIIYLSEPNLSPFQYIEGSHLWSSKYDDEIYISDRWVQTHYQQDIRTFEIKKGDLIIFDLHGIHRARPFKDRHHVRNIFQFQVEQIKDEYLGHGEQNLVNAGFIDNPSPDLFNYLGFGIQRNYPVFPNSSIATMAMPELMKLYKQLLLLTLKAITRNLAKGLLTGEWQVSLKRKLWHPKLPSSNSRKS